MLMNKDEAQLLYGLVTNLSGGYWDGTEEHLNILKSLMHKLNIPKKEREEKIAYFISTHMIHGTEGPKPELYTWEDYDNF